MLNINEDDLKIAIVAKVADEILSEQDDLSAIIGKEIKRRIDAIFVDRAESQIQAAIDLAINGSFEREYCRVTAFGEKTGAPTTIRKELEKTVDEYWSASVDPRTGKLSTSTYNNQVTRAEYLMTQICAEDFTETMKQSALNVTGALKDGLRNQLAKHMDGLLNDLFRVKSLQDQGKVEKPY